MRKSCRVDLEAIQLRLDASNQPMSRSTFNPPAFAGNGQRQWPAAIKCMILSYLPLQSHLRGSSLNKEWSIVSQRKESKSPNGGYHLGLNESEGRNAWIWVSSDRILKQLLQLTIFRPATLVIHTHIPLSHYLEFSKILSTMCHSLRHLTMDQLNIKPLNDVNNRRYYSWCDTLISLTLTGKHILDDCSTDLNGLFPNLEHYIGEINHQLIHLLPTTLKSITTTKQNIPAHLYSKFKSLSQFILTQPFQSRATEVDQYEQLLSQSQWTTIGVGFHWLEQPIRHRLQDTITNAVIQMQGITSFIVSSMSSSKLMTTYLNSMPNLTHIDIPFEDPSHVMILNEMKNLKTMSLTVVNLSYLPLLNIFGKILTSLTLEKLPFDSSSSISFHIFKEFTALNQLTIIPESIHYYDTNEIRWCDTFIDHPKLPFITFQGMIQHSVHWIPLFQTIPRSNDLSLGTFGPKSLGPRLYLKKIKVNEKEESKYWSYWVYLQEFGIVHVPYPSRAFSHDDDVNPIIKRADDQCRYRYKDLIVYQAFHPTSSNMSNTTTINKASQPLIVM